MRREIKASAIVLQKFAVPGQILVTLSNMEKETLTSAKKHAGSANVV